VVTKSEVMDLLEGAGFSRSNPYYIVPQGRVTALTNMKESDRLNLLKEIAGTRVYEARRAESLKIMSDTGHKRAKIDELLTDVQARLAELEEEKEELRGYQTKEREKRCLEYAFYALEEARVKKLLDEIENLRQGGIESTDSTRADLGECEGTIAKLDDRIHRLQREVQLCEITRRQANEDRLEATRVQAQAELKAKTLSDGQSAQEQAQQQRDSELAATRAALDEKKAELVKVTAEYNKRKLKEDGIKKDLDSASATRERLFTKQKNGSRFKNKKERDAELRRELDEVNLALADQKANRMDAEEEIKARQEFVARLENDVAELRDRIANWGSTRTSLAQDATDARDRHDELQEERKKLRREQERLESVLESARGEHDQAASRIARMMDNATARGLASIRRIKEEQGIEGAYGTLAELIEVTGPYQLPVETIAGGSLFHYVVDNADTATRLGKMLYDQRGGRVTMIPLREIEVKNTIFPRGDDTMPMVDKLRYEARFEKAVRHVFGKAVICPSLTVANQYARSHKLTAITLEGDIANKSGALTGGFIEGKHSRLEAIKEANRLSAELARLRTQHEELRRAIETKDHEITRAAGEMRKLEAALDREKQGFHPLQRQLVELNAQLGATKDLLQESNERRDQIEINMREFAETIEATEAEMATEFKKVLTSHEERQMDELGTRVQQLQKQWGEVSAARRQLASRKNALEVDISKELQPKLDALTSQAVEDAASSGSAANVKEAQRELARAQKALAAAAARFGEAEAELDKVKGKIEKYQGERAASDEQRREIQARIDRQQKRIEKSLARKSLLVQELADLTKSIRDLGVLPEEAFEKYRKMDAKTVSTFVVAFSCAADADANAPPRLSRASKRSTRPCASTATSTKRRLNSTTTL
jgi:structural maintenance of chromosome 3 (chondroitin sulfate proteoglycan 6)